MMGAAIWCGSGFGLPMVGVCVQSKCAIDIEVKIRPAEAGRIFYCRDFLRHCLAFSTIRRV